MGRRSSLYLHGQQPHAVPPSVQPPSGAWRGGPCQSGRWRIGVGRNRSTLVAAEKESRPKLMYYVLQYCTVQSDKQPCLIFLRALQLARHSIRRGGKKCA